MAKKNVQTTHESVDDQIRQAHLEQRFKDWLQASRQHMTAILIVIVAVVVAVGVIWLWQENQASQLRQAYAAYDAASTVEEYMAVVDDYADTEVAAKAAFAAAHLLYEQDEFEKAAEGFAAFLEAYPQSKLAFSSRFGRAYALEAAGRTDQAQIAFVELAEKNLENPGRQAEAWIGAGRCAQLQGLTKQARTYYENALSQNVEGIYQQQAQESLALLDLTVSEMAPAEEPADAAVEE